MKRLYKAIQKCCHGSGCGKLPQESERLASKDERLALQNNYVQQSNFNPTTYVREPTITHYTFQQCWC